VLRCQHIQCSSVKSHAVLCCAVLCCAVLTCTPGTSSPRAATSVATNTPWGEALNLHGGAEKGQAGEGGGVYKQEAGRGRNKTCRASAHFTPTPLSFYIPLARNQHRNVPCRCATQLVGISRLFPAIGSTKHHCGAIMCCRVWNVLAPLQWLHSS